MKKYFCEFSKLSTQMLYDIIRLREKVFVVEQNSIYVDCDNKDLNAIFLIVEDNNQLIATLRILPNDPRYNTIAIGRFVIDPQYRNQHLGQTMLKDAIDYIYQNFGNNTISISAQQHLEPFYSKCGFIKKSTPYLEDGIMHILMRK